MTNNVLKNTYPVDKYVFEIKTKNGSEFYQNVRDAWDVKYHNYQNCKLIRHKLHFTSSKSALIDRVNLENNNYPIDHSYLIDEDYKPEKHLLNPYIRNLILGTLSGVAILVFAFTYLYLIVHQ